MISKSTFRILPCLLGLLVSGNALAAKVSAEKLVDEFERTKIRLMNDEVKQREIMGTLYDINRKMKKIVSEKAVLEQDKMVVEGNVKETAQKIMALDAQMKAQKALLRERLSAIYKLGGQGVARLLFSSGSSAELERNLKILGIVAKQDLDLIKNYTKTAKDLESRKKKLSLRWAKLQEVEKKIQSKEKTLAQENKSKTNILDEVRKSQKTKLTKLSEIRKKSREIASQDESGLLDLLFQPSFAEQKGRLPMPIEGKLAQGYGLIRDESHNVFIAHKGHFYQADVGTQVQSIYDGRVAFSGSVPGYGNTLIIDHGDHYYSVYSFAQDIKVKEGDEVKQSQVLARSGSTKTDNGDGIYFEIRHFSEPADPRKWMKGSHL